MAFNLFKKAFKLGDIPALYNMGICYLRGDGVSKNASLAVRTLKKAADMGRVGAYERIGNEYYYGEYLKQSYEKAFQYYMLELKKHQLASTMCFIGDMIFDGLIKKPPEEAFVLFKKAAFMGYDEAQYYLGCCYDARSAESDQNIRLKMTA